MLIKIVYYKRDTMTSIKISEHEDDKGAHAMGFRIRSAQCRKGTDLSILSGAESKSWVASHDSESCQRAFLTGDKTRQNLES